MSERIELTGNIWVHHPDKGIMRIAGAPATPLEPTKPTSYAIKEVDVVSGLQRATVYGPDGQLLSVWEKPLDGPWAEVPTAEGLLNSQAVQL